MKSKLIKNMKGGVVMNNTPRTYHLADVVFFLLEVVVGVGLFLEMAIVTSINDGSPLLEAILLLSYLSFLLFFVKIMTKEFVEAKRYKKPYKF